MIAFEQALQLLTTTVGPLSSERISLLKSLNRVLASEVISDVDMPPFDKSAMDGYACRKEDLLNELQVIEEIPAGRIPLMGIGLNQCARIMTGAMLPKGADFILMQEHAELSVPGFIRCSKVSEAHNICFRGEDIKSGDILLKPGTKLTPARIAMLAASGCTNPLVYCLPKVAVISTGNELVEPETKPGVGQIRNSNGFQLAAQVLQLGLEPEYLGIAADEETALQALLDAAIEKYQVVLISGGVSVGDYDFVPVALKRLKVELLFHGINVKPGKHVLFGRKDNHFVMGMPGNPVSSFIQFEVLVKPLLNLLMGYREPAARLYLPLAETYLRKKRDTLFFIPVLLTDKGTAHPLEYHGSAHIHAYTKAQGIMEVPVGVNEIKKGEMVYVRPL